MTPRALFLDRDGTVIEDRHYLCDPAGVVLLDGVGPALARLVRAGCRLFLVSNQSGVGRGYFSAEAVQACQNRLDELLAAYGVRFTDALWCPHAPDESCLCRKPLPGLWTTLRERHGLDPEHGAMIGDKLDDLGFAVNARLAAGVLVLTGKGMEQARKGGFVLSEPSETGMTEQAIQSERTLWDISDAMKHTVSPTTTPTERRVVSCNVSTVSCCVAAPRYAVAQDMNAAVDWLLTL